MVARVNGVGEANAAKFSAEGLTVGGASFKGVAAAPAKDAKDAKPAATTEKKADVKADVKADPKAEAKAKKEAAAEPAKK